MEMKKKKGKGYLYASFTACIALALALCGGMVMKPQTTAKALDNPVEMSLDGYALYHDYGLTAEYIIAADEHIDMTYRYNGWAKLTEQAIVTGTWPASGELDLQPLYTNGKLKHNTTYYIVIDQVGSHNNEAEAVFSSFEVVKIYPLPETPSKEGHTFTGWFLDEACTQPYDDREITSDMTLYAGWEINQYTITFDSADGSAVDPIVSDYNTTPVLPIPTRTGYNFVGWYAGDTEYTNAPLKGDVRLVAHWEIQTFTVTFLVNGEVYKSLTVEYGAVLQKAMDTANLTYFILYDEQGERQGRAMVVTENMTVNAAEMTQAEKVGYFLGRNYWILIAAGGIIVVLTVALVAVIKWR